MTSVIVCPLFGFLSYNYIKIPEFYSQYIPSSVLKIALCLCISYLGTYIDTIRLSKCGGLPWKTFQRLEIWRNWMRWYFNGQIILEEPLNHDQQYIFCCFPHGSCTLSHFLTMTDSCNMLSRHYKGERRDLAASVLMYIPIVKDVRIIVNYLFTELYIA